jgi:hypothetical protein
VSVLTADKATKKINSTSKKDLAFFVGKLKGRA